MRRLRAALLLCGFAFFTLPLMPVQFLLLRLWPGAAARFPHWYHRQLCRWLRFQVHAKGPVPQHGPALIASNHVSWIDIIALSAVLPCSFIAKREVAGWPLFGALAKLQRTVFVDRDRRGGTGQSRDEIAGRLRQGDILVLFPEGTSHTGQRVLPFRSSYFGAADDPAIPVIPVAMAYRGLRGLPMSRRERPFYAWYGGMDLAPHLWQALQDGPLVIDVIFHDALHSDSRHGRKALSAAAEASVRHSLAAALHGR